MGDKVLCPEQGVGNWASLCQESKIYLDRSWKGQFWKGIFRLDYGIIIIILSNGLLFQAMFYMSNTKEIHFAYQRVKVKALKCFRYLVYIEKSFAYYFHEALWQTLSCVMTSSLPKLKIQYLIKYLNDLKSSLVSKYYTYCNFYKLTKGATRGARGLEPPP